MCLQSKPVAEARAGRRKRMEADDCIRMVMDLFSVFSWVLVMEREGGVGGNGDVDVGVGVWLSMLEPC